MLAELQTSAKQILLGNAMLILCCAFYLAWWLVAFRPDNPIKGFKSGWLLIPAVIFGLLALIEILRGNNCVNKAEKVIDGSQIVLFGAAVYVALLLVTSLLLKRQVTTELFLIVGWAVVTLLELNSFFALNCLSKTAVIVFAVITLIFAAASMVCYLLYYKLDGLKGCADGAVPLMLVVIMTAAVSLTVILKN